MAYVLICKNCLAGNHDNCEKTRGQGMAVGICVCSHVLIGPKPKFEDYVLKRDSKGY